MAAPSPAAPKAQAAVPSLSPHPPILRGITIAVWTTIRSATSSPRGAVQPATRAAMTNVAVCPAKTSTEASVSCGHTPGASTPRRRSAQTTRAARVSRDRPRRAAPRTTSAAQPAAPATPARTYGSVGRTGEGRVSSASAVRDRPVHVAENPAGEHGVEEQGTVVGTGRGRQANVDGECPGDDPPPPGRTHRGQDGERDGGHDRLPGDRAQPVLERRRAHLPSEKRQHCDACGHTQRRRTEATDGRTDPNTN